MPEIQVKDKLITLEELGAAINAKAGVTSVNNQTGAVSLTPANIGALPISGGTLTGPLKTKQDISINDSEQYRFCSIYFNDTVRNINNAITILGYTDVHTLAFRQCVLSGTKHEEYQLPMPAETASENSSYMILTSKSPVTVPQGGTGATTPEGACANIGAVKKGSFTSTLLYQGTPAVNATFTLSDYVGNYNILRIVDTHHYYCDVYMPVHTSTQTIMANGSTSYPYDGTPRFILWEFTAISSDGINYTVARKAQANITSTGVEAIITEAEFGIQIYGLK